MSEVIKEGMVVSLHYRGTLTESGEEFDNNIGEEVLSFIFGHGQMIPGFESNLLGKTTGDQIKFNLTSDEAYGEYESDKVQEVPKEQFPEDIKVGDHLAAETPDGHMIPLRVIKMTNQVVTIDFNHDLAGKALTFEVQVENVRLATEEEISHGHVHGPGGHHH